MRQKRFEQARKVKVLIQWNQQFDYRLKQMECLGALCIFDDQGFAFAREGYRRRCVTHKGSCCANMEPRMYNSATCNAWCVETLAFPQAECAKWHAPPTPNHRRNADLLHNRHQLLSEAMCTPIEGKNNWAPRKYPAPHAYSVCKVQSRTIRTPLWPIFEYA